MCMRQGLAGIFMFVAFCEVEPNTQSHKAPGHKQLNGDRLSKSENSNDRPKKRCGREIGASARRADMPKRDDKKCNTYAVAKKTDDTGE